MTYGTLDGTLPPANTPPPHQAQQYGGGTTVPPGHGTFTSSDPFTPPAVPGGSGASGRGTSVDTPTMNLFADNIDKLIAPTQQASQKLGGTSVAPGAFYHADAMRTKVNGPNADDGLKESYVKVLADLGQGLGDLRDGIRSLAQKYSTVEDASTMTSTDLQNALQATSGDFTTLMTDSGGQGGGSTTT
ncbi:hypothetical protein POF50_026575 [Streptomyces sp. SL13]|jgi:hypothetical protein|uniref:Uncharacterized protein n=1 Tax=Streptantibioticus silvisoli TaxID=2705255 RepID=A0AA90KB55_9ACTN|nr:hypothetical protein [Streptantibioticus silvisoli]MDI5963750.1 hypothetical protein [Streptantibioticus silvisoli]MDI5972867.1 hypothetical protein [Streptantibioticus silvisoli]